MIVLLIKKGFSNWVKGDRAGFDEQTAQKLVAEGLAEYMDAVPKPVDEDMKLEGTPKLSELLCAICGKEYKTSKALKAHKTKAHG